MNDRPTSHEDYKAPTNAAKAVLAEQHPDPFVQAAAWRLWCFAPGLLDPELARKLLNATMVSS